MPVTLGELRHFAVARSLFAPTTLQRALDRCGFVQADPIRAPARAQDLTLRHRVTNYRAGDLERRYAAIPVEEDTFINYGFLPRTAQALMHPRELTSEWPAKRKRLAEEVLAFVRERGVVHPREVDDHFSHGTVVNYWGGSSSATTHLLEAMHYAGLVRVVRRDAGIRIYAPHEHGPGPADAAGRDARVDALVALVVRLYSPLPAASLAALISRLRYAVPQWQSALKPALHRVQLQLARARVDGIDWYWPAGERLPRRDAPDVVRLLSPFDPVVWDRRRFELLWGWAYRLEAYTPAPRRKFGYYALPLMWRDRVIGWGNISARNGELRCELGYVESEPRDRDFKRELEAELERMRLFLGIAPEASRQGPGPPRLDS
jgi:uncharacterized protein YcaQ